MDSWADQLLDTVKKNNLINSRDTKSSTAEILIPDADELFRKIEGNAVFEIYDPKIPDSSDDEEDADGRSSAAEENPQGGMPIYNLSRLPYFFVSQMKDKKQFIEYATGKRLRKTSQFDVLYELVWFGIRRCLFYGVVRRYLYTL